MIPFVMSFGLFVFICAGISQVDIIQLFHVCFITKTHPCNTQIFKIKKFQCNIFFDIFHIFVQNVDCRYKLEPPQ